LKRNKRTLPSFHPAPAAAGRARWGDAMMPPKRPIKVEFSAPHHTNLLRIAVLLGKPRDITTMSLTPQSSGSRPAHLPFKATGLAQQKSKASPFVTGNKKGIKTAAAWLLQHRRSTTHKDQLSFALALLLLRGGS
jgi:hypothetical protein